MRKLITILSCMMMTLSVFAMATPLRSSRGSSSSQAHGLLQIQQQSVPHVLHAQSPSFKKPGTKAMVSKLQIPMEMPMQKKTETSEMQYDLYINTVDAPGYYLLGVLLGSDSKSYWEDAYDGMVLSEGKYCLVAIFASDSDGKPQRIIVKDIEVDSDVEVTMDANEATEKVSFNPLLQNGDPVKGAILDSNFEIAEEGNISPESNGYVQSALCSPKWGMAYYSETSLGGWIDDITGEKIEFPEFANMMFNPGVKDDLMVSYHCSFFGADNESCYLLQINSEGCGSQTASNDLGLYTATSYSEIMKTEYYLVDKQDEIATKQMLFGWYQTINGVVAYMMESAGFIVDNAKNLYYCIPEIGENIPALTLLPYVDNFDSGYPQDLGNGFAFARNYRITPVAFTIEGRKLRMLVAPMLDGPYGSRFFYTDNGVSTSLCLNGQPTYSYMPSNSLQIAGDNAPFIQFIDNSQMYSNEQFNFSFLPLGRLGESPVSYADNVVGKYDGKEIKGDYEELGESWPEFWDELNNKYDIYKGEVFASAEESGEIMVDGKIPSYAKTENVWNFAQMEDRVVPQLTMFQFRNRDNVVTDRFETPADGVLTLSCADFKNVFDVVYDDYGMPSIKQYSSFNGTPAVTVEYSPLGKKDWLPLAVEEQPDEFYMPGYGSFFRGNLGSVDRMSAEGWFDLRIKLADEVGNKQTVVVSPAFKISELTGIEKVVFDKVDVRVEGNNIIAPDKAMIYNAAGMRVGRKSLPRGVYMVVSDGRTTKCVVR